MTPLQFFDTLFPSNRLIRSEEELRYVFDDSYTAKAYRICAWRIIRESHLPLTVDIERWESRSRIRFELVITPVPDPSLFDYADEVPEDEAVMEREEE